MKALTVAVVLILSAGFIAAQEKLAPRLVRVVGTGEVKVVPDRAVIKVGVEKRNINARVAKQLADAATRKILATIRENGINEKDMQTISLSLQPETDYGTGRKPAGFVAEETLSITVRDLAKLDSLLESLIQAGGNRIDSIEYETSDLRKYRDQARELAVKAAREKAQALASALGQGIGKAFSIEEIPESGGSHIQGNEFRVASRSGIAGGAATALGEESISASVAVSFELN